MDFIKRLIGHIRPYNGVKTPIILQFSETECGVAALAMIFAFHKAYISFEELREKCGTSRDGCKAVTLLNVAREYGFEAAAYKMDITQISALKAPVIAFWNFNHYVVIKGMGYKKVFINDPAHGSLTISLNEFDKAFTGVVLAITPTERTPKIKTTSFFKDFIQQWMLPYKTELSFLMVCLLVIVCGPLLNSVLNNIFIDKCIISNHLDWVFYIAILSLTSAIIFIGITIIQKWNQFKIDTKISVLKSSDIISHTLQLPLLFYSLRQKSEIVAILSRVELVVSLLSKSTATFLISTLSSMICFIFLLQLDIILSFIAFLLCVLSCFIVYLASKLRFSYEKSNITSMGKLYARSVANVRNIETIKACGIESISLKRWWAFFTDKLILQDKIFFINAILNAFNKFFYSFSLITILTFGVYRTARGFISIGNLMAFYTLYLFFFNTINNIFQSIKEGHSAYASHLRINDVRKYEKDRRFTHSQNRKVLNISEYEIECKNVNFYYNKYHCPIIKNINCRINPGEHVALVGGTGSGKSTLAKLLCGLYQPNCGTISLNQKCLSVYSASELSQYFSYVSQEVSLFTGTIYDNITLWRNTITATEIKNAILDACLDDFIEARGLYGKVEENGNNLSGGERQRLDIARALLQNAPILILDEATSALDMQTEKKLIMNLRKRNIIIIFVAHRLSTIKHCDQIFVMQEGMIIESGKHHELFKNKQYYYNLLHAEHFLT